MNERENIAGTSILETHDIGISGMTCDNCVRRVEKALRGVNGVTEVHVDLKTAVATVTFDTTKTHIPEMHDALLESGTDLHRYPHPNAARYDQASALD